MTVRSSFFEFMLIGYISEACDVKSYTPHITKAIARNSSNTEESLPYISSKPIKLVERFISSFSMRKKI